MSVWVIGGTSGIGQACARRFSGAGETVFATGEEVDVRIFSSLIRYLSETLLPACEENGSPLHTVIYSAGVNDLEWLGKMGSSGARWQLNMLDVNAMGFIRVMDALVSRDYHVNMSKYLSVVAISSDAATRPLRTSIGYCASKAALDMAVRVAARELGPKGWRVNAVAPGMTRDTGMTEYIDRRVPEVRGWSTDRAAEYEKSQEVVQGRVYPGDIAEFVVEVAQGSPHLNGAIIPFNGGR